MCSPSRGCILTGRNHHSIGLASITETSTGYPGYNGILPFDRYSSIRNIRKLTCPVLLMHGEKDDIIPVAHGRTLFARAPEPKRLVIVAGAAHNDFELVMGRDYLRIIRQFSQDVAAGNLKGSEESRLVPR